MIDGTNLTLISGVDQDTYRVDVWFAWKNPNLSNIDVSIFIS